MNARNTVSAVLAEDSSSASANRSILIRATEWASAGILKVFPAEGPSFFARSEDLPPGLAQALVPGFPEPRAFEGDEADLLYRARHYYAAERDAMAYLSRAEHTRRQLTLKLRKKGHEDGAIVRALDRLESREYVSDRRFAESWLRSRAQRRNEGQGKLLAGLLARGVSGTVAREALERLFVETGERSLCAAAMEKLVRTGKTGDKLTLALVRKGFSLSMIRSCMKSGEE